MIRHWYKQALRLAIYLLLRPVLEVFRLLPPDMASAVGDRFGALAGWLVPRDLAKARAHLARAFPNLAPGEIARLARAHLRHLGRTLGEYLSLTKRDPSVFQARVRVEGLELVERARAAGRGCVILTAHFGSWELAGAAMGLALSDWAVVGRDLYDPRLSRLLARWRARFGIRVFEVADARGVLRHLKGGGSLGILIDQSSWRVANVLVPWFGHPSPTPSGPVRFAERSGSVLMMGFILREGNRHRVLLERIADRVDDRPAEAYLATYNARLEALVRERPEQWVWMHDRWKQHGEAGA
ncbi:MAG: lysophospholipid acyltransferase family protein [Candidatus Coatesbacteria bacterium]